ncbi:unnamed protein product [Adineta ricciae]|uniref:Major facilitator superfamily (MFS) profile domain-containing protein n=1 Tax=Adineta ricciae TaxID=249248 RepID=A0A815FQM1_ADIRI|nr:unnamed protein product [Adineta ricciae]
MYERRSSIHSDTRDDDDDEALLSVTTASDHQHERIKLSTLDDAAPVHDSDYTKDSDTEFLLDEVRINPSVGDNLICAKAPARYIIAIWAFFGFFCLYAMRVNLSVAIVAMVIPQSELNQSAMSCPVSSKNSTAPEKHYDFDWSPQIEGAVLGAFFYGYLLMQVIGGNLAEKFGAKWIFGGGILISGLLTLIAPIAAHVDYRLFFIVRFLTGIVSSPGFPSAAALWGKWIPPSERSTIPPASQSGANFGIIISTPLISIMIERNFLGGWPSAFYAFGVLSCVWFIGWCFFGFNSPDEHPRISHKERVFLKKSIASHTRKKIRTPWREIFTCPPVYAIAAMHLCNNYIYYTLLTSLPTYFATVLHFNLHENGLIFALPYFAQFLMTVLTGNLVDRIRARQLLSITTLRKVQTIVGTIGSCTFLVAIGFMGCDHIGSVVCCVFAVAFLGLHTCGSLISHLDVASNHAGTLVGMTNTLATIPGFIGPAVVGAFTNKNQTIEAWRYIFNISAGIGVFGCVVYCIFFNGEEQPWNRTYESADQTESATSTDT